MSKHLCLIPAVLSTLLNFNSCQSCSRSGQLAQRQQNLSSAMPTADQTRIIKADSSADDVVTLDHPTVISMRKINGVYQVPVELNGQPMSFIFDTGAGYISISSLEAAFLFKQGLLSQADVLGTQELRTATGELSQGTIINLKRVKIGDRELQNLRATVINNTSAPLLLGQSALEQFGKFSVDYKQGTVTFD